MNLLTGLLVAGGFVEANAAVDFSKLGSLPTGDSLKLPGFSGGLKVDGTKDKGKGGFNDVFQFFLAPPSLNTTVPVFSTDAYSIEFGCFDNGEDGMEVVGAFILDVKPPGEGAHFGVIFPEISTSDNVPGVSVCPSEEVVEIDEETGLKCLLSTDSVSGTETDVVTQNPDDVNLLFSDGTAILSGDDFGTVVLTGLNGNSTLEEEFGVPSSCAVFGSWWLKVPKGLGFSVGESVVTTEKAEETGVKGFGDLFSFKDGSADSIKLPFDSLEFPLLGAEKEFASVGGKGKGPFKGILSYYLNVPEINSTQTVLSTPEVDLTFSCLERDGSVYAVQGLVFKSPEKEAFSILTSIPSDGPFFEFDQCGEVIDDLETFAPGTEDISCVLDTRSTESNNPNVTIEDFDKFLLRSTSGLQIRQPEDEVAAIRTGTEGNAEFEEFFGNDGSCATFGPIILDIPKGMPFELNSKPPTAKGKTAMISKDGKEGTDSGFKLGGLTDSLKLDFDLSGIVPGGAAVDKLGVAGKAPTPIIYSVAPLSLNSTMNVFSTDTVSLDFACLDDDVNNDFVGVFFMTVKAGKEDIAFVAESDDGESDDGLIFGYPGCQDEENAVIVVPKGETFTCFLEEASVSRNTTEINIEKDDEALVQFSDGFHFTVGDDSTPIVVAPSGSNTELNKLFGAESQCLAWGYVNLLVPKGEKVKVLGGPGTIVEA
uniref:VWFD domain-containing protein n=1 Tax=Chromera velia CCMP2878 TaxID=1169474 RepID=A0A0G4I4I5_9ALVE|mmetsp:Transcript_12134/g.23453  ORF Transcript_12134/g.23453 Transcript_12134/m.23453 type:complete len:707 (+) Transcript_12134:125-2245(+)|eukprot:Cvel_10920.t1-p1 / transcript=Cvel_10920.t1 / gene=Cvel_10920 / organism=Chromera_velia_CCMP2878 / gene_product=hypothetical protein / transcript_product=hypothetical protein / location=Cvel_scaffold671:7292-10974(+) / protein_length=706 / sequence_SO=supercontig / SO=protein_coding / is_pseudo=false